jgi:uncharacterized protein YkwD
MAYVSPNRLVMLAIASLVCATCATTSANETSTTTLAALNLQAVKEDSRAARAAELLCERGTDGVVDADIRQQTGLYEGALLGIVRDNIDDLRTTAQALVQQQQLEFAGTHHTTGSRPCFALVAGRNVLRPLTTLPTLIERTGEMRIALGLTPQQKAIAFIAKPDGYVQRISIDADGVLVFQTPVPGSYTLEVITDKLVAGAPAQAPEVALLWPFVVEQNSIPPTPAVLFPDEGHSDQALTSRAQALLLRLRNDQLIDSLKFAPLLGDVAQQRAQAIAAAGVVNHRVGGQGPDVAVDAAYQRAPDARGPLRSIVEVQAQGSTLADAWGALLDSPGHRYELLSTTSTHAGVAMARGTDAAGRNMVSLVMLFGRRAPTTDPNKAIEEWSTRVNAERTGAGLMPLQSDDHLNRMARRLARASAQSQQLRDDLLGGPIAQLTIDDEPAFTKVVPVLVRTDAPTTIVPPLAAQDADANRLGMAVEAQADGMLVVVVLIGVRG